MLKILALMEHDFTAVRAEHPVAAGEPGGRR